MKRLGSPVSFIAVSLAALSPAIFWPSAVMAGPTMLSGTAQVAVAESVVVSASHGGGTSSYSDDQTATAPFNNFSGNVSGTVERSVPPQPGQTYTLPLDYKVTSSAVQNSTFGAGGISVTGSVAAANWAHAQVATPSAHGDSTFDITFRLDEAMAYNLSLGIDANYGFGGFSFVAPVFSLTALDGSMALGTSQLVRTGGFQFVNWSLSSAGLLAPGDYRLVYNFSAFASGDPLGDSSSSNFRLNLNVTAVPDAGPTGLLLAMAVFGLAGFRCAQRKR